METLINLAMRRDIKAWRDRWIENIANDLGKSIPDLQAKLDAEVDKITFRNAVFVKRYTAEKLQPLFVTWCTNKGKELLIAAEKDLQSQFDKRISSQNLNSKIEIDNSKNSLLDLASVALSGAAIAATIPTVIAASTTVVSAGGFLGLLGVTTTVFAVKSIVFGVVGLSLMLSFMLFRFFKITGNAKIRLRKQIDNQIKSKLLYSKKHASLSMLLTDRIEDTAKQLLRALDHA